MTTTVLVEAWWFLLNTAVGVMVAVTVVRVIRLDRHRLVHGWWSKLGWLAVAVLVTWPIGPITIPLGAVLTLARTRTGRGEGSVVDLADGTRPGAP